MGCAFVPTKCVLRIDVEEEENMTTVTNGIDQSSSIMPGLEFSIDSGKLVSLVLRSLCTCESAVV
jgi:hypothetical protein